MGKCSQESVFFLVQMMDALCTTTTTGLAAQYNLNAFSLYRVRGPACHTQAPPAREQGGLSPCWRRLGTLGPGETPEAADLAGGFFRCPESIWGGADGAHSTKPETLVKSKTTATSAARP